MTCRIFFLACLFSLGPAFLEAQEPDSDPFEMQFREIQKDIYLGFRPNALRNPVVGNVVIIKGENDVILFDAGRTPSGARQIVAKVREITNNPVTTVIISHGHIDHIGGLGVYKEHFPFAEIISRPRTRDYIEGRVSLERYVANLKKTLTQRDSLFGVIRQNEDRAIVARDSLYYYQDAERLMLEYQKARITLPTQIFSGDEMTIYRQNEAIKILWLGPGKTPSDIVVYLPDRKIAILGDMITYPIPYGFTNQPEEWAKTIRRLLDLDVDYFVPGHGEKLCSRSYLEKVAGLLESTTKQIIKLRTSGLSKQDVHEALDLSEFWDYFTHQDKSIADRFQSWFVAPIVGRVYDRRQQ